MNPAVPPAGHAPPPDAIAAGSSSFAAAARLFDAGTRESTTWLYAWCRRCDDVIDGQTMGHGQDARAARLNRLTLGQLEQLTLAACNGMEVEDPVFAGLGRVVRRHQLDAELPLEHLAGFRMDVERTRYDTLGDTLLYCYRVAGVVGLMMARVMGATDRGTLDRACDLGIAFQLTNIARDIVDDACNGRIYVPQEWLAAAGVPPERIADPVFRPALAGIAARLVETADPYYASARAGIGALPLRAAWSVATARDAYRAIGRRIKARGESAWDRRVSTTRPEKLWFTARGAAVALAARALPASQRDAALWHRPG